MQAFYADNFVLPLPAGHRFPMAKYQLLRDRVVNELSGVVLAQAPAATDGELALTLAGDNRKSFCTLERFKENCSRGR